MMIHNLKEAVLMEAGFASFWGAEYSDRNTLIHNYEGQLVIESYRMSFIRNAAWSRAWSELQRLKLVKVEL